VVLVAGLTFVVTMLLVGVPAVAEYQRRVELKKKDTSTQFS